MATKDEVNQTLAAMASMHGKQMTPQAVSIYLLDLDDFSPDQVLASLKLCRRELRGFPTVADIITRVMDEDGRPGADEAWAMMAKDEYTAVYTNDEIQMAGGSADKLLRETGDHVAARMAFKEVYERTVREARASGKNPTWWLSRAQGPSREAADRTAIHVAVEKKRLAAPEARLMLAAPTQPPIVASMDDLVDPEEARRLIAETIGKLGSK